MSRYFNKFIKYHNSNVREKNLFSNNFENYTNRIMINGINPFKQPSSQTEFIKRASLFALILAASSFDNRVARKAIQRQERHGVPNGVQPMHSCIYIYTCTYTYTRKKRSRSLCIGSLATFHAKLLALETNSFPLDTEKTLEYCLLC